MNTLFKIIALFLPMLMYCQETIQISDQDQEMALVVLQDQKTIDSIKLVKAAEIKKQLQLITMINKRIEKLQNQNKLKENKDFTLSPTADTLKALKQDGDVVYWEEIPRKWIGRLLNKENTKIRLFRFENGEKVYVD